jgi:hypothetical protein
MSNRMPAKARLRRFVRRVFPTALVLSCSALAATVFLTYRLMHPAPAPEPVHPGHYLLPFTDLAWVSSDGSRMSGWWIPGLKGSPGIVLAPGLGMSRSDALSLAGVLHQGGVHVLLYAQRGCGPDPASASTLGVREPDDLLSALEQCAAHPEVDGARLGIWGVDTGARAALIAAARHDSVKAIVADSPYDAVADFIGVCIRKDWGFASRVLSLGVYWMLGISTIGSTGSPGERVPVERLGNRSILFISGRNRPEMTVLAGDLIDRIKPAKERLALPLARVRLMNEEEQKGYDYHVAKFFHQNLKAVEGGARRPKSVAPGARARPG